MTKQTQGEPRNGEPVQSLHPLEWQEFFRQLADGTYRDPRTGSIRV